MTRLAAHTPESAAPEHTLAGLPVGSDPARGAVAYGDGMGQVCDDDRVEANRRALAALAGGADLDSIVDAVADLHVRHDTFPGEEFMRLAAEALRHAGVTRDGAVDHEALLPNHLPEVDLRGKRRSRFQYAVLTAFAVHGGIEPDLLDEVAYWIEQYWEFALLALVAIIRACAERSGTTPEAFAADLAAGLGIDIT